MKLPRNVDACRECPHQPPARMYVPCPTDVFEQLRRVHRKRRFVSMASVAAEALVLGAAALAKRSK